MAISDILTLNAGGSIGSISIQATLEEIMSDGLQITEHPIEQGAAITDHAYKKPCEVIIHAGWTNSSLKAIVGTTTAQFSGGSLSVSDYVNSIYSQLLALQESRKPFSITTSRRKYDNMLILALQVTTDAKTNNILTVSATCRQIIIVKTKATTVPPASAQATPASTAATTDNGVVAPTPATPAPGGAVPPSGM